MKTMKLLALGAALAISGCAAVDAPPVAPVAMAQMPTSISAADGREIPLTIVPANETRGVLIVSHGGNSDPASMEPLLRQLAARGFTAIMPTHTDSVKMPADRQTDLRGAFPTRIADLQAANALAKQRFPGVPVALLGYSYGSLSAIVGGGAFESAMPGRIDGAKAVVMFSTPGPIPGLSTMPGAYSAVDVPTLLVTGTKDVVPGFVPDPALHLTYFDGLPAGDHTAFVVKDATHGFFKEEAGFDRVRPLVIDFLASRVLGDAAAGRRFDAVASSELMEVRRR